MPVYYLPGAILGAKDHGDPQRVCDFILAPANPALVPLYLHDVGELGRYVLRHGLETGDLAFLPVI